MKIPDFDNADLAIFALLIIVVVAFITGNIVEGLATTAIAAIAGIARSDKGTKEK